MARYGYSDFNQTNMNVADKQSNCFIYIWIYHLTGISCPISLSFEKLRMTVTTNL